MTDDERQRRRAVRVISRQAIKAGLLVKPACCQRCGLETVVEIHHTNYSKPFEVQWLCHTCHRRGAHGTKKPKREKSARIGRPQVSPEQREATKRRAKEREKERRQWWRREFPELRALARRRWKWRKKMRRERDGYAGY